MRPKPVTDGIEAHVLRRFRREQVGRTITAVCFLLAITLACWNTGPGACRRSIAARQDVRALGVGMVDEVADYTQVPPAEAAVLRERAWARAVRTLPEPDCWPGPSWVP